MFKAQDKVKTPLDEKDEKAAYNNGIKELTVH